MPHEPHDHKEHGPGRGDDCDSHEHDGHDHGHDDQQAESSATTLSLAISGVLVGVGLGLQWPHAITGEWTRGIFVAAMLAGGWFLLPSAGAALRRLRPDINLLVVIAAIGASAVGQ